jgi:ATP-dependent DNA helicase RecQ
VSGNSSRFQPALVFASAALVRDEWRPTPFPKWVTCVPSLKHPELVPEFAQRLAEALGLPFVSCVRKTRETEPQKTMENSYRQAHNLENAFSVNAWAGMEQAVLLVDDMVDSGWTFTVVAALLRERGSGPVFPFALAVTSRHG